MATRSHVAASLTSVLDETRITFGEAARRLPGRKGPPTRQTVRRWHVEGIHVGDDYVRLEARRVGGQWFTSVEACDRFIEAINPDDADRALARTPAATSRAADAAGRKLAAKGL